MMKRRIHTLRSRVFLVSGWIALLVDVITYRDRQPMLLLINSLMVWVVFGLFLLSYVSMRSVEENLSSKESRNATALRYISAYYRFFTIILFLTGIGIFGWPGAGSSALQMIVWCVTALSFLVALITTSMAMLTQRRTTQA